MEKHIVSGVSRTVYSRYRRANLLNFLDYAVGVENDIKRIVDEMDFKGANKFLQRKIVSFHASRHDGFKSFADYWDGKPIREYSEDVKTARHDFSVKPGSWFKVEDAHQILDELAETSDISCVLDPFAGWGARATATLMHGSKYVGVDTNPMLVSELQNIFGALYKDRFQILNEDSFHFDFSYFADATCVFTCPPYWKAEEYGHRHFVQNDYKDFVYDMVRLALKLARLPKMSVIAISIEDFTVKNTKYFVVNDLSTLFKKVGFDTEVVVYNQLKRSFNNDIRDLNFIRLKWDSSSLIDLTRKRLRI